MGQQLHNFYLRKNVEFQRSMNRLINVIVSDSFFKGLFTDLPEIVKEEELETEIIEKQENIV